MSPAKWLALAVVVAVVAAAVVIGLRDNRGLPDDAAFAYDGTVVTESDVDHWVEVMGALYGIEEPADEDERDAFRRDAAKAMAVSMILDDAAEDAGIVISDKRARDTLARMIEGQLGDDPHRAFTDLLASFGVTEDEVLDEVKRQQAVAGLFQERTADAVDDVTVADARAYFEEDPDRFATPERRQLRNIVVGSRTEAVGLLSRLRRGDDFAALARATSLDDATRRRGGVLGTVRPDELDTSYATVAFRTRPGTAFGPVKTRYGWNVGQVVDVVPGRTAVFSEIQQSVIEALRSERALEAWRGWLTDQIREADVEYDAAYLPDDPDEPPATNTGLR
ncbi:peptidylprolyl isomerase [Nocardioides immobilis]|uniref:Peptidylprolyl isomerase n=2 Tax=Nocardioides immobilis TaxID=2049295 RepID=A0A417Y867_9ACTN|nr:peptidylprolyl isomerase [Nocardioides immobilis]